jgi:hypothetical protein
MSFFFVFFSRRQKKKKKKHTFCAAAVAVASAAVVAVLMRTKMKQRQFPLITKIKHNRRIRKEETNKQTKKKI